MIDKGRLRDKGKARIHYISDFCFRLFLLLLQIRQNDTGYASAKEDKEHQRYRKGLNEQRIEETKNHQKTTKKEDPKKEKNADPQNVRDAAERKCILKSN